MYNNNFSNEMSELVYGVHAVQAVLDKNPAQILIVYFAQNTSDARLSKLMKHVKQHDIANKVCCRRWLDNKVQGRLHQGIVAKIIQKWPALTEHNLSSLLGASITTYPPLLLILDGVTDPHNLGACLRSADAAGVNVVIAPRDRAVGLNGTVRKVSSGSADHIPFIQVTNLTRTLQLLQHKHNIWVVGTVLRSDRAIFDAQLSGPLALVMGSEERGIRHLTKKNCNELINIPMCNSRKSLNVSVATGICLFEILRQRCMYRKSS